METGKYNHFEYGKMLAEKLKSIDSKQYYKASNQNSLEEFITQISNATGIVLLAINGLQSDFNFTETESLMERPLYSFGIIKNTNSNDTSTIFEAQAECKKIAAQIIAKILLDSEDYPNCLENGLNFIDRDSFKIEGIGPVGDNFYGVELDFNFNQGTNFELDPEMWEA